MKSETQLRRIDDDIADQKSALEPLRQALVTAGYYAYGTYDDQNRWCIAIDDERGRVDIRLGEDGFEVELWTSSPGLFMEEESEWRRTALERLARRIIPGIQRGLLQPHQSAQWSEEEHGVTVRIGYEISFQRSGDVAGFLESHFQELDELVTFVENRVTQ